MEEKKTPLAYYKSDLFQFTFPHPPLIKPLLPSVRICRRTGAEKLSHLVPGSGKESRAPANTRQIVLGRWNNMFE